MNTCNRRRNSFVLALVLSSLPRRGSAKSEQQVLQNDVYKVHLPQRKIQELDYLMDVGSVLDNQNYFPDFPEDLFPDDLISQDNPASYPEDLSPRNPTDNPLPFNPTSAPTNSTEPTSSLTPTQRPSEMPTGPTPQPSSSSPTIPQPTSSSSPTTEPSEIPSTSPTLSMEPTAPTTSPSMSQAPSVAPTNNPTLSPSEMPSDSPSRSAQPSSLPSQSPTGLPSISPSEYPSSIPTGSIFPSLEPSLSPTISQQPSGNPSSRPSQAPSVSFVPTVTASSQPTLSSRPSGEPSSFPSSTPTQSIAPSQEPSSSPTLSIAPTLSLVPSALPSARPSSTPSQAPSLSLRPSSTPSEQPSISPSNAPSTSPSGLPSAGPSSTPSAVPSSYPSSIPSAYPSFSPSDRPSTLPSSSPSTSPSTMPSTSPSLLCHDIVVYRSPINDLTCDDHKDTECLQWRFLGLNTTELGNLIESCPETCGIPCGSFNQFSIPITFRLSRIPGLLDDSNIATLEDAALEHVIGSVAVENPEIVFELDDVNLKGQEQVEQESRFRRTRLRRLQENTATVDVTVWFTGFALSMTNEEISDLLSTTIEDADFAATLRNTEEFYDTVIITSATGPNNIGPDGAEPRRTGASSATIAVSALVSGSILCFALGSFIYHSRSGRWVPWSSSLRLATTDDIGGDIICHSPINGPSSVGDVGSPRNSLLSFDTSGGAEMQGQGGGNVPSSSTLIRLIASLSLSPRSNSNSSTQEDISVSGSDITPPPENDERKGTPPPLISPMSEATEDSGYLEHPLASVIPPMIVIDHIDEVDKVECGFEAVRKKQQVPSKHVEASSDLISALKGSTSTENSNLSFHAASILLEPSEVDMGTWTHGYDNDSSRLSPIGIIDSDSDDETSVASTPVRPASSPTEYALRRVLSSSALESNERRRSPKMPLSKPLEFISPKSLSPTFHDRDDSGLDEDHWVDANSNANAKDHHEEEPVDIAFRLGAPPPAATDVIEPAQFPPMHPSTPDRSSTRGVTSPSDGLLTSIWSLSPMSKAFKDPNPPATKPPSFPKRMGSNVAKRSAISSESLDATDEVVISRRAEIISSDLASAEKQVRHEFETPRKGQLGLVLDETNDGPVVLAVKDYSPLFGLVKKGDKLIEVDGKKTLHSTVKEVTKLLSVRPNRRSSHVRIAVARPFQDNLDVLSAASSRHNRGSSYGSEPDDLLRATYYNDYSGNGEGEV